MIETRRLYALLRDRTDWRGAFAGVRANEAGDLSLIPLPGLDGARIDLPEPYDASPSGLARAPCGDVFIADSPSGALRVALSCGDEARLGAFAGPPGGMALAGDLLWVVDPIGGAVLAFRLPDLRKAVEVAIAAQSLAVDRHGRVALSVPSEPSVLRLTRDGAPDDAFNDTVAAGAALNGGWSEPLFLTTGARDWVLVSDVARGEVLVLDETGNWLGPLDPPPEPWAPGAVFAMDGLLLVACRDTGRIWVMEATTALWLGTLPHWRGPVAALAAGDGGALLIKPGPDVAYHVLEGGLSSAAEGTVQSGPFDAGLEQGWARVDLRGQVPDGASFALEAGLSPTDDPLDATWVALPGERALLDLPGAFAALERRFAWLRVALMRGTSATGPVLHQAELSTAGPRLIDSLPRVFARKDGRLSDPVDGTSPRAFLRRFLDLLGSDLAAGELVIEDLAQALTVAFATPETLDMLSDWLALDVPPEADLATRRALLARAIALHARRGTAASIREIAWIWTGQRPVLTETFRERGLWVLDASSRLGFDTMLPMVHPEGWVVEGEVPQDDADEACAVTVGHAVVGETMPLAEADIFEPLFDPWAHHFRVHARAPRVSEMAERLVGVLEGERPAHTHFELCLIRPGFRIGQQALVGLDTIVSNGPRPVPLDSARLDRTLVLARRDQVPPVHPPSPAGITGTARLGIDTGLG